MTTAEALRERRDAIYELQADLLRLYCKLDLAADEAEAQAISEQEARRMLKEARECAPNFHGHWSAKTTRGANVTLPTDC